MITNPAGSSIGSLVACASQHLDDYTVPTGGRAFWTYDRIGDPDTLTPLDCLAPALLSVRIDWQQVIPLFAPDNPGATILSAMQAVLDHPDSATTDFLTVDLDATTGAWHTVDAAILASGEADGVGLKNFKAVAVTKILHRKRPQLVPIFDSLVYAFFVGQRPPAGPYREAPRRLWQLMQPDLVANQQWLEDLATRTRTAEGRPLTLLRVADIIVWEHQRTGCAG